MKDRRIVVIAGLLIVLAVFGFSYYGKKAPSQQLKENQPSISSTLQNDNIAPVSSTAPENKEPASSVAIAENKAPAGSATPTEVKTLLSSAAAIEQAKKNGESMWLLFRSTTCIPCVEMQKVFDQLEPNYKGKVRFIAIDVNDKKNMEVLRTWKIQYIPTSFIIDSSGKVNYQNVGVIPVEDLKKELNKVVK
jgi:thioredoxin 1